jgi:transcriptional regulator with XRE-family HTH domain
MQRSLAERVVGEIRAEMARQDVTQAEVAQKLGVTQQTLSKRFAGLKPFDLLEVERLADILGVPVRQFLNGAAA